MPTLPSPHSPARGVGVERGPLPEGTTPPAARPTRSPLRGVLLYCVALLLFACLDTATKYLTTYYPVPLVSWSRYALQLVLMTAVLAPTVGRQIALPTRPAPVVLRSLCLVLTSIFVGLALRRLPVAEASAIVFLSPLLVVLLAGPLLGERLTPGRAALAGLGFVGVLLIARPGGNLDALGVFFALLGAASNTGYQLLSRVLSAEPPLTLLFNSALVGVLTLGPLLPFFWKGPPLTPLYAGLFLALGLMAGLGHFLLTLGFRYAPASLISPVTYLQLVWAGLLGWLVFRHIPDALSLCGMAVIAGAGVATVVTGRPRGNSQPSAVSRQPSAKDGG
ncbi:DMT family transporter [Deinococcus sp. YIM 134068]|uniref:DMT family transporter n=1 Tax=Deinococcus lichenicola TaxID=3118910 RepID=UPI002F93188D